MIDAERQEDRQTLSQAALCSATVQHFFATIHTQSMFTLCTSQHQEQNNRANIYVSCSPERERERSRRRETGKHCEVTTAANAQ